MKKTNKESLKNYLQEKLQVPSEKTAPIQKISIFPEYENGNLRYCMFESEKEKKRNKKVLKLFRVTSASNMIRSQETNEDEFQSILKETDEAGASFVCLSAFQPEKGKGLILAYGVLADLPVQGWESVEEDLEAQFQALRGKFRNAYRNVRLLPITEEERWLFDMFTDYQEVSLLVGFPQPDPFIGANVGTRPYAQPQQATSQVMENFLKGMTGLETDYQTGKGAPFLMYSVLSRADYREIRKMLEKTNRIISMVESSEFQNLTDSENTGIPLLMNLGLSLMSGDTHSVALAHSTGVADSHGTNVAHSTGTNMSNGTSVAHGQNQGISDSQSSGKTDTQSNGGGWNVHGSAVFAGGGHNWNHNNSQGTSQTTGETKTSGSSVTDGTTHTVGDSTTNSKGSSSGETKSVGSSRTASDATSQGNGGSAGFAGGVTSGESSSVGRSRHDSFQKTINEKIYYPMHARIQRGLNVSMYQTRTFILTPDPLVKKIADKFVKQALIDPMTPYPIHVMQFENKNEERLLMRYAKMMEEPETRAEELEFFIDPRKYQTNLLPGEASAYGLPLINLPGYISSIDPIPESLVQQGTMKKGAYLGQQWDPIYNLQTEEPYLLSEDKVGHIGFFGGTESGKTTMVKQFIVSGANDLGWNYLIFDQKEVGDYRSIPAHLKSNAHFSYHSFEPNFFPFRFNPLRAPKGVSPELWIDKIMEVFCRKNGLGEGSYIELTKILKIKQRENKNITLADLYQIMQQRLNEKTAEEKSHGRFLASNENSTYSSLLRRLEIFTDRDGINYQLFCPSPSEENTLEELVNEQKKGNVHLFECGGLPEGIKQFVIGTIATGMYMYCAKNKKILKPTYLIWEEAQTIMDEPKTNEPLQTNETIYETLNREARAHGIYTAYIVQEPKVIQDKILSNMPNKVIFNIEDQESKNKLVSSMGKDPLRFDVDLVKWLSRQPMFVSTIRTRKMKEITEGEPSLIITVPLREDRDISNEEFRHILIKKKPAV